MSKKTPTKLLFFFFVVVFLSFGFGGGFILGRATGSESQGENFIKFDKIFSDAPTFRLIEKGVGIIDTNYVDSEDIEKSDLVYGAMKGMLEALGDPYSIFLKPKDSKVFQENVNGAFEGIGAEIGIREGQLTIIAPLKDSPAEKAGLKAGDKVVYVDDTATKDLSLDEAVQIIRGPKGSEVVLTVSRDGEDDIQISIIRETIKIPNIIWEDKGNGIAHISLYHFTERASGDFRNIANDILKSDSEKIILDLRNNPGGFLEVAVDIAGWFLPEDKTVAIEDRGSKGTNKLYKSRGSGALKDFSLVVLVNKGSASASEILAGALRDHLNVKLVGEGTFGKGSVQELVKLRDGSGIKITVAKWLTPSGKHIEGAGLQPDVLVEMNQDIFDKKGDVQLEKAIEMLKEL